MNSHGLFANGVAADIIVIEPFNIPDDPEPAIALPTINILEFTETPHISDPSSKKPRNERYVY